MGNFSHGKNKKKLNACFKPPIYVVSKDEICAILKWGMSKLEIYMAVSSWRTQL